MLLPLLLTPYSTDSRVQTLECIRIARLTHGRNDVYTVNKIIETFARYSCEVNTTEDF